jgi:hypothetical protein
MDEIEQVKEKEKARILKLVAKKEIRASMSEEVMRKNLEIKKADRQAKAQLLAKEEYSDLLSEKQVTNKLCMELADLIGGELLGFKCHVFQPRKGARQPMIEDDFRQVSFVDPGEIKAAIYQFVRQKAEVDTNYLWSMREVDTCYNMWMSRAETLTDVKTFDWLDGVGLTFRRLPFNYVEKDTYDHPTWDSILDNIEVGRDNFINFIGSIFEPKSYNQQYLWLQGSGGDGKGTLLRCLENLLTKEHCVSVDENMDDRFWAENLETARIAYFDDCKNTSIPTSKRLLQITGGTSITIEKKGLSKFIIPNNLKIIFTSQYSPTIQSINRDKRRLLIVTFKDKKDSGIIDPRLFEEETEKEFPEFISMCVKSYRKKYPNHDMFQTDKDSKGMIEEIGAETDINYQVIIDQFFILKEVEEEQYKGHDFDPTTFLDYFVKDTRLTAYLAEAKVSRKDMGGIRRFLSSRWGVKLKSTRRSDYGQGWYYHGIREKNPNFEFDQFNPYRHGARKNQTL